MRGRDDVDIARAWPEHILIEARQWADSLAWTCVGDRLDILGSRKRHCAFDPYFCQQIRRRGKPTLGPLRVE